MALSEAEVFAREEKLGRLTQVYLEWDGVRVARNRLEQFCRVAIASETSSIGMFCGKSGAGKSTFLTRHYGRTVDRKFIPNEGILFVEVPAGCTPKALAQELLLALNDSCANCGTQVSMTNRLIEYIRILNMQRVILDEVHNFIDSKTGKVAKPALKWMLQFLNAIGLPVILVGLPDLDRIIFSDDQLRRRTLLKCTLHPRPFGNTAEQEDFRKFLLAVSDHMPFTNAAAIANVDFARKIHHATLGLVGFIIPLLKRAGMFALERRSEELYVSDFWDAFQELQSEEDDLKGLHNPFSELGEGHVQ